MKCSRNYNCKLFVQHVFFSWCYAVACNDLISSDGPVGLQLLELEWHPWSHTNFVKSKWGAVLLVSSFTKHDDAMMGS